MPQRFLRPGITTSKRFNRLDYHAQIFYVRLLTLVDDFGRYDSDPMLLRSHAFPFGSPDGKDIPLKTIDNICLQLVTNDLAEFYRAGGKEVVQITRWNEKARAASSKYLANDESCEQMFSDVIKCSVPSPSPSPSPVHHRHSPNGSGKPNTSAPTDDDWLKALGENSAYKGIDVRREHAKMVVWCKERKNQPTRRRFINWLNRAEKPMTASINRDGVTKLDPTKIAVPSDFKKWAVTKYPDRSDDIEAYEMWSEVPPTIREEWRREKITPILARVGG